MREKFKKLDLNLVLFVLALAGFFIKYIYFSTIGSWEDPFETVERLALYGLQFFGVLVAGGFLELGLKHFKAPIKTRKEIIEALLGSTVISGLLLLLMMASFEMPIWFFAVGAVLLAAISCLKAPLVAGAVFVYFMLIGLSYLIMGSPSFLTAPYSEAALGDWNEFRRNFHSVGVVAAGMATGPFSFNLLLPLIAGALMLANRKYGQMLWSLLFYLIFGLLAALYIGIAQWQLPLFLLNGSVLLVAVFFIPMELKRLPQGTNLWLYIGLLGLLAFVFSYYVHFVWGVYLGFLLVHGLLWVGAWFDKKGKKS